MNPKEELSPEEKLLRLIRQPSQKQPVEKKTHEKTDSSRQKSVELPSASALPKKAGKKRRAIVFSGLSTINFILINRFLLAFLCAVLSLFVADLYFNNPETSLPVAAPRGRPEAPVEEKQAIPFSHYQQVIASRELFKSDLQKTVAQRVIPAGETFKDLVKNLTLMGIISGENPQAIIEDGRLKKTFFLYEGDFVGEVCVAGIGSDKVVLEYKGERINLFM